MAYPLLSVVIAVVLFAFVSILIVPQFESIFRDYGVPMPRVTLTILEVSRSMSMLGPALAVIAAGLLVFGLVSHWFLRPGIQRAIVARIPILGGVWRWTSLAEFCHLLSLLLESRLPLAEALRLTGEGVQDADVEKSCLRMAQSVESGQSLARAMAECGLFPSGLPRLVYWGTRQGSLTEVLLMAGALFESRAAARASFAGTMLGLLSVFLILWGLFTVVVGLMIPLYTLLYSLA
jgi:type IV pilus assembly protein PilC